VDREYKNIVMHKLLIFFMYLIISMMMIILFFFGPRIEVVIFPVISDFAVTEISEVDNRYFIKGVLYKNRGECAPKELNIYVGDQTPGADPEKIVIVDLKPDPIGRENGELRTRSSGSQFWGPWEIFPPDLPLGPIITFSIIHQCHFAWQTQQILYRGVTSDFFPEHMLENPSPEMPK